MNTSTQVNVYDPFGKVEIEVDERIVPLLKRLWDTNMVTWQSCAGHFTEGGYDLPYIGFDFHKTYAPLSGSIFGILKDQKGYDVGLYYLDRDNQLLRCDSDFGAEICLVWGKCYEKDGVFEDSFPEFERDLLEICNIHKPAILAARERWGRKD